MGSRAEAKKRASKKLAHWYVIKPFSLLPVVAYLLAIVILPLARGQELTWAILSRDLLIWAIALFAALILAWIIWRAFRRADWIANAAFAALVLAAGVWSVGLNAIERSEAREIVRQKMHAQVAQLKSKAHGAID